MPPPPALTPSCRLNNRICVGCRFLQRAADDSEGRFSWDVQTHIRHHLRTELVCVYWPVWGVGELLRQRKSGPCGHDGEFLQYSLPENVYRDQRTLQLRWQVSGSICPTYKHGKSLKFHRVGLDETLKYNQLKLNNNSYYY